MEKLKSELDAIKLKVQQLEELSERRSSAYVWSDSEVRRIAPYYKGKAQRFCLRTYIQQVKERDVLPRERRIQEAKEQIAQTSTQYQEPKMDLTLAVRNIFHMSSPNYTLYMGPEGFDNERFVTDLKVWIAHVTAIWISMDDTKHGTDCTCCVKFSKLVTNWDSEIKRTMSEYEFSEKQVTKNEIIRWAKGISTQDAKASYESMVSIGKAIIDKTENRRLSDMTTDSSEMSNDASESGCISTTTEAEYQEQLFAQKIEQPISSESSDEMDEEKRTPKCMRYRKRACIELETVVELDSTEDIVKYAIPEVRKVVTLEVFTNNVLGRHGIIKYQKNFFQQLLKINSTMSSIILMSNTKQTKYFKRKSVEAKRIQANLARSLDAVRPVYTTRSQKKSRDRLTEDKIKLLKKEIYQLRKELKHKEEMLSQCLLEQKTNLESNRYCVGLSTEDVTRYSRQMLVSDIGLSGQKRLKNGKVLIVGAGGLGCPAAVYLASAGIGEITIVDYDTVELSNLHRQILHTENDINIPKVNSAYDKLHSINRSIKIIPLKQQVNSRSITELLHNNKYDVVIDGSDNVATRYLLNDACVLNNIPLVSGSALQLEAQLTVFNYKGGPCYRCLFPIPPPPDTVTSCGDGGVLGPVPGVIGVLQALEAIKILVHSSGVLRERYLLFDGSNTSFRSVRLRPRNANCAVCGDNPSVTHLIDYEQFCGASAHDKVTNINILDNNEHITINELPMKLGTELILDVRPAIQYEICRLPHTYNVPYTDIEKIVGVEQVRDLVRDKTADGDNKVYVLCRRGNDSQRAIAHLKEKLADLPIKFVNVKGGLHAYSKHIDSNFPDY